MSPTPPPRAAIAPSNHPPSDALFSALELPRLESLTVKDFSSNWDKWGLPSAVLPSLTALTFAPGYLSRESAAAIAAAPWYLGLQRLALRIDGERYQFTSACKALLSARFRALSSLKIDCWSSEPPLDELLALVVAERDSLRSLESLWLRGKCADDPSADDDDDDDESPFKALAAAPLRALREFHLDCSGMSAESRAAIKSAWWRRHVSKFHCQSYSLWRSDDEDDEDDGYPFRFWR